MVFTEGHGLDLRFVAYSEVIAVDSKRTTEGDVPEITVIATINPPSDLPEDLTLRRFMYSLVVVSNFGRPWLHLRHKSRLFDADIETLRQSRVFWNRTVFFGLLRELPAEWRAFFEYESRALRARANLTETYTRRIGNEAEPTQELRDLLESTLMSTVRIAADVQRGWSAVLGANTMSELQVVEPDGTPEPWNVVALVASASREEERLDELWVQVGELPFSETPEEGEERWRLHRW